MNRAPGDPDDDPPRRADRRPKLGIIALGTVIGVLFLLWVFGVV